MTQYEKHLSSTPLPPPKLADKPAAASFAVAIFQPRARCAERVRSTGIWTTENTEPPLPLTCKSPLRSTVGPRPATACAVYSTVFSLGSEALTVSAMSVHSISESAESPLEP